MCIPMAVLGLASGLVSGIGAAQQANAQAASFESQAEFERRQADIELETGAYRAERRQDEVDRALGTQRAQYGASGLALSGTPADVIAESAQEGALDVAAIRWNSGLAAGNQRFRAQISESNARDARRAAPLAFAAPVLTGVARYGQSFAEGFA